MTGMEVRKMLFNEIYGCYFNAVAEILQEATKGTLTGKKITEIIHKKAFGESFLTIADALKKEEWPLLTEDMKTPLQHAPTQPLTIIQKRWMKSLFLDPKIHLFEPDASGLENVPPLYKPEMFVYFDRYQNGDPFEDASYIKNFRTILKAFKTGQELLVNYLGRTGLEHETQGIPKHLEYSAKDDKFRLILLPTKGEYRNITEINLARMTSCCLMEATYYNRAITSTPDFSADSVSISSKIPLSTLKETVVLELLDERNALQRAMLHFSYLEKETEQLDQSHYRIAIHYDQKDETEILIQILSFGSLLRIVEPSDFKEKIKRRIDKQMEYLFNNSQ